MQKQQKDLRKAVLIHWIEKSNNIITYQKILISKYKKELSSLRKKEKK